MDAIKKNLGFISYCLVCVVLMGILAMSIRHTAQVAKENREEIDKQEEFFKRIGKGEFALTGYNVEIARKNRDLVATELNKFRGQLHARSSLKPMYIRPIETVAHLKEECLGMHRRLADKDIVVAESCRFFSFDKVAAAERPPPPSAIPAILKQVRVVQEIVRIAAGSYLREFNEINRPKGLDTVESGDFLVTPFNLKVTGGLEEIRDFVNSLQDKAEYLFFLRRISLEAVGTNDAGGDGDGDRGGMSGMGRMGGEDSYYEEGTGDGMDEMGGRTGRTTGRSRVRGRPQPTRTTRTGTPGSGPQGGTSALGKRLAAMQEDETEMSMEERLVFTGTRTFVAALRVDLVEFQQPETAGTP